MTSFATRTTKRARVAFGVVELGVAALVLWGVFRALPARWWVVDGGAAIVALLLVASGVTLLLGHRLAEVVTRAAGIVTLALGLALVAGLALGASWLAGVHGSLGRGGAALFGVIALLVLPYLVVLPAALLAWVGPRSS
ncbi:MAG: hypothetical protein JWP97_2709 [Labilithrix sp.]|nr:hypothetical protein [Labilithrix sp.]